MENKALLPDIHTLSQSTLALQHETQLISKKVDVVGVLQAKVNTTLSSVNHAVEDFNQATTEGFRSSLQTAMSGLQNSADVFNAKRTAVQDQVEQVIEQVSSIKEANDQATSALCQSVTAQADTAVKDLDQVANVSDDLRGCLARYDQSLDVTVLQQALTTATDAIEKSIANDQTLDVYARELLQDLENHMGHMVTCTQQLQTLNHELSGVSEKADAFIKRLDEKVTQISPLYTGPSAADIQETYENYAQDLKIDGQESTQTVDQQIKALEDSSHAEEQQAHAPSGDSVDLDVENLDPTTISSASFPEETPVKAPKQGFFAKWLSRRHEG